MSVLPVLRAGAMAAVLLVIPAKNLGAQSSPTYEQYAEAAWADGKLDAAERAQFKIFDERGALEAAKAYATEKFDSKDIETGIFTGRSSHTDARLWVPMTAAKANREVEADAKKARWHHSAVVDYDGDGTLETARLSHAGRQMAVVVEFKSPGPRKVVVWQSDLHPDVEIYSAGKRIMMNWPDLGHKILFMHNGQPSVVHIGD